MYLNFKKESTNLINDFNNFKFLKKKYIKKKKKKKLNIYSLLVSNNNTESLKVNNSLDIFKFKNFLKIMRNFQKKKYDNKKVFKFWKKKIYFKKKNIKKKKKKYHNFIIFIKKSKNIKYKNKNIFKFLFYKNKELKKIWFFKLSKFDKKKSIILFNLRNRPKLQYWNNVVILKKNLTTLQVFKFKVPKEKNKFLESFYLKKDNFLNKEKFFFSKFFYKIQNINKSFKKYMKELIKNKNLEKKRFIFYLYNYIYLKYIYIRKLKNIIKNSIYKKKLNWILKKKKNSKIYFKFLKKFKKKQFIFKQQKILKKKKKNIKILKNQIFLKKIKNIKNIKLKNMKKFKNFNLKKKKTFKKKTLFFWFFFNQKPFFKYKLKHFFKKFLIFFNFHKTLILKKKKKKTKNNFIKKKLFQHFFWDIESRINIFLVRVGFLKNLNQSNFCIKKKFIFINNKNNLCFNFKVKKNDLIQISYFLNFFLNIFSKKNIFINFFLIQRLVKKKKNLFFLEINKNIQSCLILYKPKPKNLDFKRINKFNFFFYKYLFYFLKKKNF